MSQPKPNSNTNEQDEEVRRRLELEFFIIGLLERSEWVLRNFWSLRPGTDNINYRCNQCDTNDHDDKGNHE